MQFGNTMRRLITGAALLAAVPAIGLATAQPSQAAGCGKDKGGKNAVAEYDGGAYKATFCARDEKLTVLDQKTDKVGAYVKLEVFKPDHNTDGGFKHDEWDEFFVPSKRTFQLGSPDGTGDIREGMPVRFKVCKGKGGPCSGWEVGKS